MTIKEVSTKPPAGVDPVGQTLQKESAAHQTGIGLAEDKSPLPDRHQALAERASNYKRTQARRPTAATPPTMAAVLPPELLCAT